MLFQVRGNAETLDSIATSLPQILGCSSPLSRHTLNLQRRIPKIQVPDMPDRIIAATAHSLNIPLITCDHKILACSAIQTIW